MIIDIGDGVFSARGDATNIREELCIMRYIKHHKNVVNMLGHCTTPGMTPPYCYCMDSFESCHGEHSVSLILATNSQINLHIYCVVIELKHSYSIRPCTSNGIGHTS